MINKIITINTESNSVLNSIPEITYLGNSVLRNSTEKVTIIEGIKIGNDLIKVLLKYRSLLGVGVGLASTQIGSKASVFVTHLSGLSKIYINPKITFYSKVQNFYRETCLSSPHFLSDVQRSENILISYHNKEGESIIDEYSDGFLARLIQHEYDHLMGIVSLDRSISGSIEYKTTNPKEQKLRDSL